LDLKLWGSENSDERVCVVIESHLEKAVLQQSGKDRILGGLPEGQGAFFHYVA
jgi:hypothetical protein